MKKITKSSLLLAAKEALGNSIKRLALVGISIIALSSTILANCYQTLTSGAYNVSVSMTSPSPNNYVVKIVSSATIAIKTATNLTINTNQNVEVPNIAVYSNANKTCTFTMTSTTVPVFYTDLFTQINGVDVTFTWPTSITWGTCVPTLGTTTPASAITSNTASSGGNVLDIGSSDLTARGVCWSTTSGPTITSSPYTSDAIGSGTGTFTSSITSLTYGLTYYVKSYATNSAGTGYGAEVSFTTTTTIPAAPTPTLPAANVISIYSDPYTSPTNLNTNPNWGQTTAVTIVQCETNNTLKYTNLNYQGTQFDHIYPITNSMQYLHIDIYTTNETSLKLYPICWNGSANEAEKYKTLTPINLYAWNSYDIPLTDFTSQGLTMSDVYQIKIVGSGGTTVYIDNMYFYKKTAPSAPINVVITPGNSQLTVAFTAGSNGGSAITNYKYSTNGGTTFTACSPMQTTGPVVITGLANGTSYNIQLEAVNEMGDGTASSTVAGTPATTPGAPTIGVITPGNGQLSVAFTAGSSGGSAITNYKYSTNGGSTFTACSPTQTTGPIIITPLTNGTSYNIQLKAVNAMGEGTASSSVAGTPRTVPGAPTSVTAAVSGITGTATVSFTAPASNGGSAITSYTATSSPGGITSILYQSAGGTFTFSGLTNGTAYTFTVTATNAAGTGPASTASGSVTPYVIPASPTPTATSVISLYSNAYTPATTTTYREWWSMAITDYILADGGNAKKMVSTNSAGSAGAPDTFTSPSTLDVSGKTHLHVDVYPTTATSIGICLVSGGASSYVSLGTLTANQWNSKDIALTNYAGKTTAVTQVGFNSPSTGIFYMDNLYFYTPTAPNAPTIGTATAGIAQATVTFTPPAYNGGSPITVYTVTSSPAGITVTGTTSPIVITGLTNGTTYTFTVKATNAFGTSVASGPSNSVTPGIPASPTPTYSDCNVKSIYSDTYTPATTVASWESWRDISITTATLADGGNAKKFDASSIMADGGTSLFASPSTLDVSTMTYLHIDIYPTTATSITVALVIGASSTSSLVSLGTLTANQWNSKDIALTNYKTPTDYTTALDQIRIDVPSSGTFYMDNLYFYKRTPCAPTITAITPGNGQLSVAFTAGNAGGSAITNYSYSTNGGSTFTACSPAQTTGPIVITGLANGTTYNVQIKAVNSYGDGTASSSVAGTPAPTSVTISTTEPLSPYYPSSITDVTVTSTGVLTVDATETVKSITAYPGAQITLATGKTLTVVGAFILQSDATGAATFLDNGTLSAGSASVQQYLPSGRNWYISSPVSAATSSTFNALNYTSNKLYWDDEAHGSTVLWPQIINNTTPLDVLRGYIANLATTTTVTFSGGTLNTGEKSITVYRTAGQYKEGFNLVGNPYPSYLDWDQISNTSFFTTMWYRSKNADNTLYVFDTYNAAGQIGTGNNGVTVNNHIPPMQAFWVQVKDGLTQGTLTVNNSMRSHKGSQGLVPDGIFKTKATQPVKQSVLRLKVSTGNNTDEAIIYSNTNASNGFDMYDSPKMFAGSTSLAEIFTLAGNQQLVINGLNNLPYGSEIPLGFTTSHAGTATYSLRASEFSNFEAGTRIILKDYKDVNYPVVTDLSDGGVYTFTSTPSSYNTTRFTLIFKAPSSVTGITPVDNVDVWISTNGHNQLIINGILNNGSLVEVFNTIGQKIISTNSSATNYLSGLLPGVYLVTITQNAKKITQKIILN